MLNLLIYMIVTLLVVGLLLWAVTAMPWIDASVKQMIRILVIVFAVLWIIGILFPGHWGNLHVGTP